MTTSIYTYLQKRTNNFFKKAKLIHGDRYDYSLVEYKGAHDNVKLICPEHGVFPQRPSDHLSGSGCPDCGIITHAENKIAKAAKEFETRAKEIHGERYDYSKVEYKGTHEYVDLICKEHGTFPQTPHNHLIGQGCPDCGYISCSNKRISKAAKEFKSKAKLIHGDKYDYSKVEYKGSDIYVDLICPEHGTFPITPNHHLSGKGCPECSTNGYSKVAIKWLNFIDPNIQHAENGGEFRIPNTKYRADGYDPTTNTIYEFHGDDWHGNPNLYSPDDTPHPFNKTITAGELYENTIQRENEIKSLGYNLVVMWESKYKKIR